MSAAEERLRELCTAGLRAGEGDNATPGDLCLEQAVALAAGEELTDHPACVSKPDAAYGRGINDAHWSSPEARAEALLPLGIAQLGTAGRDRTAWVKALAEGTIRRVLPMALRAAARLHHDEAHRGALRAAADRCEAEGSEAAARAAAKAAWAAELAAEAAAARTARTARAAAEAAARAAAWVFRAAEAAKAAVEEAAEAAADAAVDASLAAVAPATTGPARDAVLREAVQVALDAYAASSLGPGAELAQEGDPFPRTDWDQDVLDRRAVAREQLKTAWAHLGSAHTILRALEHASVTPAYGRKRFHAVTQELRAVAESVRDLRAFYPGVDDDDDDEGGDP